MLTDIDLDDGPTDSGTTPQGHHRHHYQAANQHDDDDNESLISNNSTGTNSKNKRTTIRGRRTYNFSISKRPRRNVKRQNITHTSQQLEGIDEERASFLNNKSMNDVDDDYHDANTIDRYRAPRIALVLFMLVCLMGGYRSGTDAWTTWKENHSSDASSSIESKEFGDVTYSFRASSSNDEPDGDRTREALDLAKDKNATTIQIQEQNIEDIPTILFNNTIDTPEQLSNLVDIFSEPYNPRESKLFLWHVPRSGSTTITRIASYCLGLTIASSQGKSEEASLAINELRINEGPDGVLFANVDMSNPPGIQRAKSLNVGSSSQIDLITSSYLWDMSNIFDEQHKGYMVAMIRHPIERAASLYYSMKKNKQYEEQVGSLGTLEQYAKSSLVENNWMTRFLSNTLSGELTPEHEAIAKEVLRTKCLIGLLRDKTETLRRLDVFFNIHALEHTQRREECQEKLLYWDWPGKNRHDPVVKGSEAWDILQKHNTFDMRVYEYAEKLFEAQGKLFHAIESSW